MYIIVVGGGKVGYYLSKALINEGHEVLVIERNGRKVDNIVAELGSVALRGDGCEVATLQKAGAPRADLLVAVTGDDEDNLVACQLAKSHFNVPRTIARINNPKNETIFKKLGIDATVSSTEVILAQIEQQIPAHALVHLLTLRTQGVEVVETTITEDSPALGKRIRELDIPEDANIPIIIRDGKHIVPHGETQFEVGDAIIAVTTIKSEDALNRVLSGDSTFPVARTSATGR